MLAANRAGMGTRWRSGPPADGVTHVRLNIGGVVLLIFGSYCFAVVTGFERRSLTRRVNQGTEDSYDRFADFPASSAVLMRAPAR
jgi:hypothetical protein